MPYKDPVVQAAYKRQHYLENKHHYHQKTRESKRRQRARKQRTIADYLSAHPCVDCGESDLVVLQFDHRDHRAKEFNVSHLLRSGSLERLLTEVAKCDVRCSNCHIRRTASQFGSWRLKLVSLDPDK